MSLLQGLELHNDRVFLIAQGRYSGFELVDQLLVGEVSVKRLFFKHHQALLCVNSASFLCFQLFVQVVAEVLELPLLLLQNYFEFVDFGLVSSVGNDQSLVFGVELVSVAGLFFFPFT